MIQKTRFQFDLITLCSNSLTKLVAITLLSLGIGSCNTQEEQANTETTIPVQLKTIESTTVVDSSEYLGTLQAKERVSLAPRTDGRILEIFVRQGDRINKGDPIVRLEPTREQENVNAATQTVKVERAKLGQAQAELKTAQANRAAAAAKVQGSKAELQDAQSLVELTKINVERTKTLVQGGALARQRLDNVNQEMKSSLAQRNSRQETLNADRKSLQATEKQVEQAIANIDSQYATIKRVEAELASISQNLAFNTITAPIDGTIGSFEDNKVGDYVSIGEQVTTITNNQSFDLNLGIPVEYRDRLKLGLPVETLDQDSSRKIRGKITYIAPLVQQNTQSILTKVTFPDENQFKDQEYLRVRVIWDTKPGILVPANAVSTLGGQNFVYVMKEDSQNESSSVSTDASSIARQQPIKLGRIQAQNYHVISGLQIGDRIAVSNILNLRDGTPIKSVSQEQAMSQLSDR